MSEPVFRVVCPSAALAGAPAGWAAEMLRDGELALVVGPDGFDDLEAVARELGRAALPVMRPERTPEAAEATVYEHAAGLALVWIASGFSEDARDWARDRGPMTLLVENDGALPDEERRRIERFVAILTRQAE